MNVEPDVTRVARHWDREHAARPTGRAADIHSHPMIHCYMSLRARGRLMSMLDAAVEDVLRHTRPGARILSIGCGRGGNELQLAQRCPGRFFEGIDIAERSLAAARDAARALGIDNATFRHGDANRLDVEEDRYDAVLGLHALHHVEQLEDFWQAARRTLRPGGVVIAQEYIGASRQQWPRATIQLAEAALRELVPERLTPAGHRVHRPDVDEMIAVDPSEAVRSDAILPTLQQAGFELKDYGSGGCGLLFPTLHRRIEAFEPTDWRDNLVLADLFRREDQLMRAGLIDDANASFVAAVP